MKKPIVVFSGAGLSQESGIPTFRDSDGLWENHRVEDVASPEGWERDNQLVLDFYKQRFENIKNCEPNAAHKALARLEEKYDVFHITQNIDDLLERAGATNVTHIHGSINSRRCSGCDYVADHEKPVELGELCTKCQTQLRPNVVWFGEPVYAMDDTSKITDFVVKVKRLEGTFICVGTSAVVYPAAYLVGYFSQVKNKYIVDVVNRVIGNYTTLVGKATEKIPELVDALMEDRQLTVERKKPDLDDIKKWLSIEGM